jgi:hypothetical protein
VLYKWCSKLYFSYLLSLRIFLQGKQIGPWHHSAIPVCVYACGIYMSAYLFVSICVSQIFSFPKCPDQVWNYPASYSIDPKGALEGYWPGSETDHSHLYRVKMQCTCMVWCGVGMFVCVCVHTLNQPLNGINSRMSVLLYLQKLAETHREDLFNC